MNICREIHEKICYAGTNCPLCAMRKEIESIIEGCIIDLGELLKIGDIITKEEAE